MIAYLDSSVVLRLALNQPKPLAEFRDIRQGISSRLLKAECLRTLDRLFAIETISERDQSRATLFILKVVNHPELIPVDPVLESVGNHWGFR